MQPGSELRRVALRRTRQSRFTYQRNADASLTVSDVLGDLDRDEVGEHTHV
jgi:hypothetical protein